MSIISRTSEHPKESAGIAPRTHVARRIARVLPGSIGGASLPPWLADWHSCHRACGRPGEPRMVRVERSTQARAASDLAAHFTRAHRARLLLSFSGLRSVALAVVLGRQRPGLGGTAVDGGSAAHELSTVRNEVSREAQGRLRQRVQLRGVRGVETDIESGQIVLQQLLAEDQMTAGTALVPGTPVDRTTPAASCGGSRAGQSQ